MHPTVCKRIAIVALLLSWLFTTPGRSSEFYAYYTTVDSGEPWEQHSRTGRYADVVVQLGEDEFVFSRASSYLPYWKTDRTKAFVDELVSRKGDGTATMPDRINRYSYVRIIENRPEKAVVHWRYFSDFSHVEWDGVVDEYFTLTPDRKVVRTVRKGTQRIDDWNDPANVIRQTLVLRADGMAVTGLTPAKIQGRPGEAVQGAPLKTSTVGSPVAYWNFDEGLRANHDVTSEIASGRECSNDRAAHSSLVWGSPSTNIMMYGLTNRPAKSLLPLARSWNTPPAVVDATGCTSLGYRPEERAYIFTASGPAMSFRLIATEERPVVNPCFVIKRWRSDALASLTVNGSAREPGRAYRQGVIRDTDGTRTMVIWVALTSDEVVRVEVASYSAESGQKGTADER